MCITDNIMDSHHQNVGTTLIGTFTYVRGDEKATFLVIKSILSQGRRISVRFLGCFFTHRFLLIANRAFPLLTSEAVD